MKALERTVEDLQGDLGKATNQINRLTAAAKKPAGPVQKLTKGFARLAVAIGSVATAQKLFASGLKTVTAEAQLVSVASAFNEVAEAQAAATRIQTTYNLSAREANSQFAQILARLRPLGIELKSVEDAYGGLATAIKIAGLDAAGAGALFTQVAQGLGSGTVQAEELNTVLDQSPLIVVALAEELGVAAGQIKKLASDGGVSSEALLKALIRVKDEGVEQLAASLDTPAEKIKFFQNVTEDVADKLTRGAIFDLTEATKDFAVALGDLAPVFEFVGATGQVVLRGLIATMRFGTEVAAGFGRALTNLKEGNFKALIEPDETGLARLQDIWKDLTAPLEGKLPTPPARTPGDRPDSKNYGGSDGGGKSAAAAAKAAQREAEAMEKALRSSEQSLEVAKLELKIAEEYNVLTDIALEGELERLKINQQYDNALLSALSTEEKINIQIERGLKLRQQGVEEADSLKKIFEDFGRDAGTDLAAQIKKANEELTQTEELMKGAYEIVSNQLTSGIQGLIDGTKEWGDVLSDILGQLGSMFLNAGFNGLGKGLKIPGYADGGRPTTGEVSVIGERGPELFVPDQAGTVIPNDAFDAATAALSRGGGGGGGTEPNEAAFAAASSAVQEKMSIMRQGQEQAANNPKPIDIRYQATVINNETYVTAQQFQAGMSKTANQARAQTLKDLRNKPAARSRAGVS